MNRPIRPKRYIAPKDRAKNKTLLTTEYWNKCLSESIEYDKQVELFQGNAMKELLIEQKKISIEVFDIDRNDLIERIKSHYLFKKGIDYDISENGSHFLDLIIDYCFSPILFEVGQNKFESNPLIKNGNIGSIINRDKGLCIVGNYGIGKTSLIDVISDYIFNSMKLKVKDIKGNEHPLITYRGGYSGMNLVAAHVIKAAKEEKDKNRYNELLELKNITIDDIFSEDKSYGQETLKDFLEQRYTLGLKTSLVMNYSDDSNNLDLTIESFGKRYGARLMDRFFEMFNLIEFTGKSKRK